MPINKNQLQRLQTILGIMKKKEFINFRIFSDETANDISMFQISSKTFSRDIRTLQEIVKAPIEYNPSKKAFYLTDPDWVNEHAPVSPGDMKLLLLSERVSRSFMPPQLRSELANAVNELLMKREGGMPNGMNLENFQIINPDFVPRIDPEVFLEVYQAWESKHYLKITYSSSQGHQSVKLIEPHVLAWDNGIWYIKGLVAKEADVPCEQPFAIRIFALHRIESAEKRPGTFFTDEEDIKRIKSSSLFNFQPMEEVDIEFFQPCVKQMAERFSSQPDAIISQDENSIRIHLTDVQEYAALRLISHAKGNVKVHKPASLQNSLRQLAQTILDNMK